MRSRLKLLGWIVLATGPLVFVWVVSHPRRSDPLRLPGSDSVPRRATAVQVPPAGKGSVPLRLTGEVVDGQGRPVADALVTLVDPEGRGDLLAPGRPRELRDLETRTDERGAFRFENLSPGSRRLIAHPEGRAPAWTGPFLVEQASHQVLTLPTPVSLTGLTHARATLSFLARIPGMPHAGHRPVTALAAADEGGAYRVEGLPPSIPFAVRVEADGYRSRSFGPYQFPPGKYFLDFDLDTGLTLRGTVRDGAGRPVAGARAAYDDARTLTGADGTFTLAGLEERSTTLIVSREGHIQTVLPSLRPGSVEVTLPRAAEVTGRVIGGRGQYVCFSVGDSRYRLGLGDSDTFRIPSLPPGRLRLDVEDAERRLLGSAVVDVMEGGSVEGVEIPVR